MEDYRQNIKKMKEELALLHLSQAQKSLLNNRRDELEALINRMQDEKDALEKSRYAQNLDEFDIVASLTKQLNQKQHALSEMKAKFREIDHLLDQCEEQTKEMLLKKEADLALLIIEKYPAEKLAYEDLQKGLKYAQLSQEEIQNLIKLHNHLLDLLQKIFEIRIKVRRQGIFSYVFGRSPNIQISQYLEALSKVANNALDSLEHYSARLGEDERVSLVYAKIRTNLIDLQVLCKQTWNFKKIDDVMTTLQQTLSEGLERLEKVSQELEQEGAEIQRTIQTWINKYS
ncbi:MAG: hypothetical protein CK425_07390 [Parachlamydia sp.]|nr:MAG: hypothetical protein CK425_07390 [Parachlamydia sp.]